MKNGIECVVSIELVIEFSFFYIGSITIENVRTRSDLYSLLSSPENIFFRPTTNDCFTKGSRIWNLCAQTRYQRDAHDIERYCTTFYLTAFDRTTDMRKLVKRDRKIVLLIGKRIFRNVDYYQWKIHSKNVFEISLLVKNMSRTKLELSVQLHFIDVINNDPAFHVTHEQHSEVLY